MSVKDKSGLGQTFVFIRIQDGQAINRKLGRGRGRRRRGARTRIGFRGRPRLDQASVFLGVGGSALLIGDIDVDAVLLLDGASKILEGILMVPQEPMDMVA